MSGKPDNSGAHSENATVLVVDDDHDMVSCAVGYSAPGRIPPAERAFGA